MSNKELHLLMDDFYRLIDRMNKEIRQKNARAELKKECIAYLEAAFPE